MPVIANNSFKDGGDVTSPPAHAFVVTPSDVDDLPYIARELYVGVAGDVSVVHQGDSVAVVYKGVSGLICGMIRKVTATNTTATDISARY
jgi:hypothetical protein